MRELGCESFLGVQDAEVAGRWLRKVENTLVQLRVPEDRRVDCVTQLLTEQAQTWWETVQLRRSREVLEWRDFKKEFETKFYSRYHRKAKEQEFLMLRQGSMTVLEYERRFHDLSLFAPHFVPTEQHMVERLRDGLRQELKQGLIALPFQTARDLVEAAQALEACIRESPRGQVELGKRKEVEFSARRPPLPKRNRAEQWPRFGAREISVGGTSGGVTSRVGYSGTSSAGGFGRQHTPTYPYYVRCEQRHPGDCTVAPGHCYICRQDGHRWKHCLQLGVGCYFCGERGHYQRECPRRTVGQGQCKPRENCVINGV